MNNKSRKKITFQAIILAMALIYLICLLDLPKQFNARASALMVMVIISFIGLIYILIRNCCNNVKKWEVILYYILNIIFMIVITYAVMELTCIKSEMLENNNPYNQDTQLEQWYNFDEDAEYIGLGAMLGFFLLGIPFILATIIFSIIGIVKSNKSQVETANIHITEGLEKEGKVLNKNIKTIYCSYCGKMIDVDASFCKYCGKKIK